MASYDKLLNKTLLHNHNGREITGGDIGSKVPTNSVQFDTTPAAVTNAEGLLKWNSTDGTLDLGMSGGDITQQIGQELFMKVRNVSGSTIPNGSPVYISGRTGNRPNIYLAKSDSETTAMVIGLTTQDIESPADGFVTTAGYVRQIKTDYSGTGDWGTTWEEGDRLYVSKTVAGQLTNVEPTSPHHSDLIGTVAVVGGAGIGSILVTLQSHKTLEELTDVDGTDLTTSGQFPNWNQTTGYFDFDKNINDYTPLSVHTDMKDPTGFVSPESITATYSTTNRTITLTGTLDYYWRGVKKTLSSPWVSSAHANTVGNWYLYSSDGTNFAWSTDPWSFDYIMVSKVNYSSSPAYQFALKETHGLMPWQVHLELHEQINAYRETGGALIAGTYAENTDTDAAITPSFDAATIRDEDNLVTIPQWDQGTYTTMYIGASSKTTFSTTSTLPFTFTATGYINYNNTTTGTLVEGATGKFYNVYQILVPATTDTESQKYRMLMLQPQRAHPSLADARAEDVRTLVFGDLLTNVPEFVIYARITYATNASYTTSGKVVIPVGGITYITGSKLAQVSVSGFTPANHNDLTGLQGGTIDEYYHSTLTEYLAAQAVPTTYLKLDLSNVPLTGTSLTWNGNAARDLTLNRHTTANTAGNNFSLQAGGATSGATDKAGGQLILKSGISTGTGGASIIFQTTDAATSSGTSDNSYTTKMTLFGNGQQTSVCTVRNTASGAAGVFSYTPTISPTSTSSTEFRALYYQNLIPTGTAALNIVEGGFFENRVRTASQITSSIGVYTEGFKVDSSSAATAAITTARGLQAIGYSRPSGTTTSTVTSVYGLDTTSYSSAGLTATNAIGLIVNNAGATGTITNLIGIDIATQTRGTTNIGMRIALPSGGATANYALQLSDTGGTAAGGITFGTDTNLYRSAADTLRTDDSFFAANVREKLTADRTYYVRTDGNDSNTGLANTAGGAFLTIQKAVDVISTLDSNSKIITVQVADGTYTGGTILKNVVGYSALGDLIIQGNTTTPSNVVISPTATACFSSRVTCGWQIQGFKLETTTSGNCLYALAAGSIISWQDLEFGACADAHMYAATGGYIVEIAAETAYTISGGADYHYRTAAGGILLVNGNTITLTGTPAFTTFCEATQSSTMTINANTYSGSATGKRYNVTLNATVTSGTTLPGDSAGTTATGGQYS